MLKWFTSLLSPLESAFHPGKLNVCRTVGILTTSYAMDVDLNAQASELDIAYEWNRAGKK